MGNKFIEHAWNDFVKTVFPNAAVDSQQYATMRQVFFSGALCTFLAIERLGDPSVSESTGERFLTNLEKELEAFRKQQCSPERN